MAVMRAGSVLRGLRAAMFAAVCVLLASMGHALMSATPVPSWLPPLAWLVVASAAWSVAGRERGLPVVGALTVGMQALLHAVFSLAQAVALPGGGHNSLTRRWTAFLLGGPGPGPGHAQHAQHAHHGHHAGAVPPDQDGSVPGMVHSGLPGGTSGMLAMHVLLALLSAWWLWGGERAVFRAVAAASVELFAPLVFVVDVVLPVAAPIVFPSWCDRSRAPRKLFLTHVIWLRGPPRGRAA